MNKNTYAARPIARVDMHVHSCYSKHPSEWILQRLGAHESYTPAESIYRQAKEQGCAFVTLTDHNTIDGALELCRLHPDDCFISTEATAYFPEDGCKVHILCYGITPEQFAVIQRARDNIYNLRDYLRQANIAGDGPEREALEQRLSPLGRHVRFTGRLDRDTLKGLYVLADALIFPSTTDITERHVPADAEAQGADFTRGFTPSFKRLLSPKPSSTLPASI